MPLRVIGQIVPSSNRTVERTTQVLLRHFPDVGACFARITYYGAGLGQPKHGYDLDGYRLAAWQLGHAKVDVVSWNGTKGASIGLAEDEALCRTMADAAECTATTASLDTRRLLRAFGVARAGFVTPADARYAEQSAAHLGVALAGVRALGLKDNLASAAVAPSTIADEVRALARTSSCDAILLWSTNLPGWSVMAPLERELGIPVLDSACIGIWGCLVAAGIDPWPAAKLGRMFTVPG